MSEITAGTNKAVEMARALDQVTREHCPKVGKPITNGGVVLMVAEKEHDDRSQTYYVLCVVQNHFQPFVVWTYSIGITDLATGGFGPVSPAAYWGHYCRKLPDALAYWTEKVETVED